MKKIFFLTSLCLILGAGVYAQKSKPATIQGVYDRETKSPVVLSYVSEGEKLTYATTLLDAQDNFAFQIVNCEEGFYYLSDTLKRNFVRIYLKPGEDLKIKLTDDIGTYELTKGSEENKVLADWVQLTDGLAKGSTILRKDTATYQSFFPMLMTIAPKADLFKNKIATKNKGFNQLMKTTVDFDMDRFALGFLYKPNRIHPTKDQYPSYYKSVVNSSKLTNTEILSIGESANFIGTYVQYAIMQTSGYDPKRSKAEFLEQQLSFIPNDTLKGVFIANNLRNYSTYDELIAVAGAKKQYFLTPLAEEKYFNALKSSSTFKKGTKAYNFSYPDPDGKTVSLKDLEGKVVVLDVWATWCGPCKEQIPYLLTLEEEMKGKAVEFVSISVDEEKDYEKWKKFIADKSLGGIQLFGKGWSDITKFYGIKGIPRFMVFDQKGNIVSVDAPRPSTPDMKTMIEETLQGK